MDLANDLVDWLLEHYYSPVKILGGRDLLSPLELQLEQLGLVKVEVFGMVDQYTVLVLSPTSLGHQEAAHFAPIQVFRTWGLTLSPLFLKNHVIPYLTLADLPGLLVSKDALARACANMLFHKLGGEELGEED